MFDKVFGFLADRFLDRDETQPQVGVTLQHEGGAMRLVLTNESQDAAADLKLFWPEGRALFEPRLPYGLAGFESKAVTLGSEPLPAAVTLLLTYRDLNGRYFATRYRREKGEESQDFLPYDPKKGA